MKAKQCRRCERPAMPGKFYCTKHVHGQDSARPKTSSTSSYNTINSRPEKLDHSGWAKKKKNG